MAARWCRWYYRPYLAFSLGRLRSVAEQLIRDGVVEGVVGRIDDVGRHADGRPAPALGVGTLDHHTRRRRRAAGRVENAHLEVDQAHVGEFWIDRDQRFSQRSIERVHGAVALAHL